MKVPRFKRCFFLLIFIIFSKIVFAQPNPGSPTGACLVIGQFGGTGYIRMYTLYNPITGKYALTPYSDWASSSVAAINRTDGDSKTYRCAIWNGGYVLNNTCTATTSIGDRSGTFGNFTGTLLLTCVPIDDCIPFIVLLSGIVSFFYIKNSKTLLMS